MLVIINIVSRLQNYLVQVRNCRFLSQFYPINHTVLGLSVEQLKFRETIFNVSQKYLAPKAQEIDEKNNFDEQRSFWKILGDVGALGVTAEPTYGGSGGTYLDHVIALEEVTRASGSVGLSYGAHSNLCVDQISKHGTEEQKQKYLPKLCSGEHIGGLAMSESAAGSNVLSMKLRADKKDDHYVLNGNKSWITNGPDADVLVVYAKTDFSKPPQYGITTFIIEKKFEGFSTGPKLDKLGMRGSNTCELIFENCIVPKENVLGEENKGAYILTSGLNSERLVFSALPIGLMQAACDVAFNYANERNQFGQNIGEFQMIQSKLATVYTTLSANRCYLYNVVKSCDKNNINSKHCASVALFVSEKVTEVTMDVIQILGTDNSSDISGGNGYINSNPIGRILRDAKLSSIGAGTEEIRKLVIARAINKEYSQM